jgi:hypothetical protein
VTRHVIHHGEASMKDQDAALVWPDGERERNSERQMLAH